ncbi:Rieske (2Fe-2S) protein [Actinopolymorpha sp. B17G11]|uniref:Rieske (2Fe-2S) protein n=1 Tax=unclassified Actinopolymorpha TaxID=2627063 RepID=UPI0032D8C3CA
METTDPQARLSMPSTVPPPPAGDLPSLTRRRVLSGVAVAGAAVPVLAACAGGTQTEEEPPADGAPAEDPPAEEEPSEEEPTEEEPPAGADALAKTADIPVGGGVVLADQKLVVTQPAAGEFKAFSALCTHKGCPVNDVTDGSINCPCHGSKFSASDGSVTSGPATEPLETKEVTVNGDSIMLA